MDEPPLQNFFTLLVLIFLLVLSFFFSASETAFSSLNRIRMKNKSENGSKRAALVLRLYENYDRLISAILVGNNIVNITAASVSAVWFTRHFESAGATISAILLTSFIIFFCEITPKSLAKENPEAFALFFAPFMYFCMTIFMPVNAIFTKWKRLLNKYVKTSPDVQAITEELLSIVEEAEQEGTIDEEDKQLIHNAIEFGDLRVDEIITPRIHVMGIAKDMVTEEAVADLFLTTGYTRIPVYDETIDNIIGMMHLREFFEHMLKKEKPLMDIITPAVFAAPSVNVNDLLKQLQKEKSHMAVITDEYGGTMGIVTMEDILEELVGEIWDENDEIVEEFIPLDSNQFKVACSADIEHMFEFFKLKPPDEVEASTISGWIMDELGKIPEEGDLLTYENLSITVNKVENRRVLECLVKVEEAAL